MLTKIEYVVAITKGESQSRSAKVNLLVMEDFEEDESNETNLAGEIIDGRKCANTKIQYEEGKLSTSGSGSVKSIRTVSIQIHLLRLQLLGHLT